MPFQPSGQLGSLCTHQCAFWFSLPADSVTVIVQTSSQSINAASTATAEAVAAAAASVCNGGPVQAAANSAAQATASATGGLLQGWRSCLAGTLREEVQWLDSLSPAVLLP